MAENDWISEMAAKRQKREKAGAAEQERRDEEDQELKVIHDRDLPGLKEQFRQAAERLTDEVKQRMGYGPDMTCLFDPIGTITMRWSKTPDVKLVITIQSRTLGLDLEMTERGWGTDVVFPGVQLRPNDGRLQIFIDGQPVTTEDTVERLLRPFFEYVAART